MPKQLVPVRIEPETLSQLDRIVAISVGERSDHLRKAIEEYIARYSQEIKPDPILDSLASRYIPEDDGDPYPAYLIE
jgi:metal-responsive CopG/Arc/MetJ family transcriptional regulator